ncbi:toxin [Limosilactobacillus vaginalis]|uniref:Toxin n=1 Tax=Limosilactobacillus vaginalis TaxID=1633 RepID=A0ABT4K6P3_9LACO|nr:ImmA/IrrE family metallo-endopeptidase [Limosilactobacillus vaginalis]MCZ3746526.1 toxin [Limosilactobacillus vaginalis]MCZ3751582.1 toxin [Limosilactobacillus vaginalis]MCZ3753268.1 toxin [Limosilactobacillus vaginalis]MCZ3755046.1 toxin [Limosilactobacillus vaginalis]MCZ3756754.1 toxin [Limosilactobacillus vaginalis]
MYPYEQLASKYPHINVLYRIMPAHLPGLTVNNNVYISEHETNARKYEVLQEEIAHYETTVGDITAGDTRDKRKQENKARSLAMERTVTLDNLIYCYYHNLWTPEEIADYCNVEVEYLYKAIDNYRTKYGPVFRYKRYVIDMSKNIKITLSKN